MIKYILLPFSWLYGLITDIRNYLYDKGLFQSKSFEIPIINVGNITVGGTGKSPQVEYLIRLLKDKHKIVTLSRGYGRKTKGFIWADETANASTIGDEPMQFYQKFGKEILVIVGEKRVEAIEKVLQQKPDTEVVILDDAFQHRAVRPSLNILLIDYNRPIDEDYPFPAGRLRERRHGAKRADVVIITKCPDNLSLEEQSSLRSRLRPYLRKKNIEKFSRFYLTPSPSLSERGVKLHCPPLGRRGTRGEVIVLFTKILYGKPINCRSEQDILAQNIPVLLVSGIANPALFENYAKQNFKVLNHIIFKDHHAYSESDFELILKKLPDKNISILMTEKDMVKIQPFLNHELLRSIPLFYLPIETGFLNENEKLIFDSVILP
jgi:tetraacyldisaccharide 4'-kinase